jgi:hypothetical protein
VLVGAEVDVAVGNGVEMAFSRKARECVRQLQGTTPNQASAFFQKLRITSPGSENIFIWFGKIT